jgi:hypothetical protein
MAWDAEQTRLTLDTDIHSNDFTGYWDVKPRQPIAFTIGPPTSSPYAYLLVQIVDNYVPTPSHPDDISSNPRFFGYVYYLSNALHDNEYAVQYLGQIHTGREIITIPSIAYDLGMKFAIRPAVNMQNLTVRWKFF